MNEKDQPSLNILVIDDDERVRMLLRDILVYAGHHVTEASDGESGMRYLEEGRFDIVLTDLGMPLINGWEVAKSIKKRVPEIPVFLITGWGTHLDKEKIRESGIDFIIGKPFQINEILDAVNLFRPLR